MEAGISGHPVDTVEELYAKPYKNGQRPSADCNKPEQLYDRLDRQSSMIQERNEVEMPAITNEAEPVPSALMTEDGNRIIGHNVLPNKEQTELSYGTESVTPYQRGLSNHSIRSYSSGEMNHEHEAFQVEVLETKDTNDIVKEISNLGLELQSDRLITALRSRFELESAFIDLCAKDGIIIVEGDSDVAAATEHQSIGGLRVKGMRPSCVNYDEYDPDIIHKYSLFAQGLSKEQMANDAAELRRRAANMLWAVENMERMIDPNSRVRYVRQEEEN